MTTKKGITFLAITFLMLISASTAYSQTITGKWIDTESRGNPLFTITFGSDGSYRAVCTDEEICSFCAGGDPIIETGTYSITDDVVKITVSESNAPNNSLRIDTPIEIGFNKVSNNSVTFSNASLLTFDWAKTSTVDFTLTITGVEKTTWRAVKELFK